MTQTIAPVTPTIAVVGLGYVGLPLAVEFGKQYRTIGFDLSHEKVEAYRRGVDPTGEVSGDNLRAAQQLSVTTDPAELRAADFVVVAVPTPVDEAHRPDFSPLVSASQAVGKHLKRGATVVFESTVYPGATEEVCVPIIEKHSGMAWKTDFFVGYSPERINPGDKDRTLTKIVKVGQETRRRPSSAWRRYTGVSSKQACTARAASASPRRRRSSKTRSVTSTSR